MIHTLVVKTLTLGSSKDKSIVKTDICGDLDRRRPDPTFPINMIEPVWEDSILSGLRSIKLCDRTEDCVDLMSKTPNSVAS